MRTCGKCGGHISDIARFCEHCGVKLEDAGKNFIDIDASDANSTQPMKSVKEGDIEELDLTELDKKTVNKNGQKDTGKKSTSSKGRSNDSIIDLQDILEKDEKVTMDDSIKREVLADDEILTKVCPMCGEAMDINRKVMESGPILVKCLKCGNETKVW
jgi:hypothetical protein